MGLFSRHLSAYMRKRCSCTLSRLPTACRTEWVLLLTALSGDEADAVHYLIAYSPWTDLIACNTALFHAYAVHACMLFDQGTCCAEIPPELFLPFVLHPRVNDEPLTEHRTAFYRALCPRVKGKSLYDTAVEVNYWCCEQATYRLSDARTLSPEAVVKNACGRCGEESTLAVAALRCVGVPARQCYAPKWAHCDDNHAWVEVWTGEGWHYLGACEPQPRLDRGWFTFAASRAPLIHTRAFYDFTQEMGDAVLESSAICCTMNRTPAYAKCKSLSVTVLCGGAPVQGVRIGFEVLNFGAFYPVCTLETDRCGVVQVSLGKGDFHLHITDGNWWMEHVLRVQDPSDVVLELADFRFRENVQQLELNPPVGFLSSEKTLTREEDICHTARIAACGVIRSNHENAFCSVGKSVFAVGLEKARGNRGELAAFLRLPTFSQEEKAVLLATLCDKDLCDCTSAVLSDTLSCALAYRGKFPEEIWRAYVLAPRISLETLVPQRASIAAFFEAQGIQLSQGEAVAAWMQNTSAVPKHDGFPGILATPINAMRYGVMDDPSRDLAFVAICRAMGIPARFSPLSGLPEFWRSGLFVCAWEEAEPAYMTLEQTEGRTCIPGETLSLSVLRDGMWQVLQPNGIRLGVSFPLPAGCCRLIASSRQIDGAQLANVYERVCHPRESYTLSFKRPRDRSAERLWEASLPLPAEMLIPRSVLCFVKPGEEPSEHLLLELQELAGAYLSKRVHLTLCTQHEGTLRHFAVGTWTGLCCRLYQPEQLHAVREALGVGDRRLPFSVAIGEKGEGLWAFANYNVGTAQILLDLLDNTSLYST